MRRLGTFLPLLLMGLGVFVAIVLLFGDGMSGGFASGRGGREAADGPPSYLTASTIELEAKGTKRVRKSAAEKAAEEAAKKKAERKVLKSEGVFGIVTDAAGTPLPKASVMLLPDPPHLRTRNGVPDGAPIHSAVTDEKGEFVVGPSPDDGSAKVRAEAPGYAPTIQRVRQRGARVDLVLDKGGALNVKLLDAKGEAVSGASVIHQAGTVVSAATSGEDGVARFLALPTGTGSLVVTKDGYGAIRDNNLAVAPGETEERTLVLPDALEITGSVLDAETERPLHRAEIRVRYPNLPSLEAEAGEEEVHFTDEEGHFKLKAAVSGQEQAQLRVTYEGYAEARVWRNAMARGDVQVKLTKSGEAFEGSVLTENRQPLKGARVTYAWMQQENPAEVPETATGEDGAFVLPLPGWAGAGSGWTIIAISDEAGVGSVQASVPRKGKPPAKEVEITLGGVGLVKGVVTDGGGTPVAGAVVSLAPDWNAAGNRPGRKRLPWQLLRLVGDGSLFNLTAVSGADGTFRIPGVPALEYKVSASYGLDLVTLEEAVEVASEEEVEANVALGEGGTIEGWILDTEDKPVAGAYVSANPAQRSGYGWWRTRPTARSQSDGKFVLRGIGDEKYTVWASASGFGNAQEKNVSKGDGDLRLSLKARGWIVGKVNSEGSPFRGMFTVTVRRKSGGGNNRPSMPGMWSPNQQTRTFNTDDGHFEIRGLGGGDYTVTAKTPDGLITVQADVVSVVDGRGSREAHLELTTGATLTGSVRNDETGRGMPNAWVYANAKPNPQGTPAPSGYAQTDAQGRYEIKGLGSGAYTITVWMSGSSITKQLDITAGERRQLDLVKQAPGMVTFVVTDAEGTPLQGARPNIRTAAGGWVGVNMAQMRKDGIIDGNVDWRVLYNTNGDGMLTRYHVPPGVVKVWVTLNGYANSQQTEIDVRSGATTEVAVTLKKR